MAIKSIKELIDMKETIEAKRKEIKKFYIPSLETDFEYKQSSRMDLLAAQKMEDYEIDLYNIYKNVVNPDLSDKELQARYNRGNKPHMIVDKLLNTYEVSELSKAIAGIQAAKSLVNDIKN